MSFLSNGNIEDLEIKLLEEESNLKYRQQIIDNLSSHPKAYNECVDCPIDLSGSTPIDNRNIIEVECKGVLGVHFAESVDPETKLHCDDLIIVECEDSIEISRIIETEEIVRIKRQRFGLYGEDLPKIKRKANNKDVETYYENLNDELKARPIFKEKVDKFKLNMKLVDIHYQFDRKKLFFFYTSDGRVDFRELAKDLASTFKTRIELRQIGVRDEAKRIGGLGTCGREYCCAAFLNNFKRITTQLANDQNLTSNMSKLSGPCGKLKCCLSFEIE